MKLYFIKIIVIITAVICGHLPLSANDTLQFELTPDKIESVRAYKSLKGYYSVRVLLKDRYRKYLAELTDSHIDEKLSITYSNITLLTSVIMAKIDSGVICIEDCGSKEDAQKLVKTLQGKSEKDTNNENKNKEKAKIRTRKLATKCIEGTIEHLTKFSSAHNKAYLIEALNSIEETLKANKEYCQCYYWKAFILAKLSEYQKAISALNQGLERPCENLKDKIGNFYFLRAVIKHKTQGCEVAFEDYTFALEFYKRRLSIDSRNWEAIMNIAQTLKLMNKNFESLQFLKDRIEKNPQENALKQIMEAMERFDTAEYIDKF